MIEKAYAKINLTLDVLKKRDDGYHEVRSVMCPLELHDEIFFELTDGNIELSGNKMIKDNIMLKAAWLLKNKYNISYGVKMALNKQIPIEAGLAGGSADASATLRGLNKLWGLNLLDSELATLSEQIGSDTPFCIYNKMAIVKGRGEKIEFIDTTLDCYVLLIKPPYGASTKEIFNNHVILKNKTQIDYVIDAIKKNDIEKLNAYTSNDLEATTLKLINDLKDLKEKVNNLGYKALMSGSGPTLYVLSKSIDDLKSLETKLTDSLTIITKVKKQD